jgi:hypothetical protein
MSEDLTLLFSATLEKKHMWFWLRYSFPGMTFSALSEYEQRNAVRDRSDPES